MSGSTQIKCPNCGTSIDVQDILAHQLEDEIKQKYQAQLVDEKKKYKAEQEKLDKAKQEFEEKKKQQNELFQERLEKQLKEDFTCCKCGSVFESKASKRSHEG